MQTNEILAILDKEIAHLQHVRSLLAGTAGTEKVAKKLGRPKGRKMSPEGRARIAAAQKARWETFIKAPLAAKKAPKTITKASEKAATKVSSKNVAKKTAISAKKTASVVKKVAPVAASKSQRTVAKKAAPKKAIAKKTTPVKLPPPPIAENTPEMVENS